MGKKQKKDLVKQFQNLIENGGLAYRLISEQDVLFEASTHFKCSSKELAQRQILSYIRHNAFYNYDKTATSIRSPELKEKYHKMVNDMIFELYPWIEKYRYKEQEK